MSRFLAEDAELFILALLASREPRLTVTYGVPKCMQKDCETSAGKVFLPTVSPSLSVIVGPHLLCLPLFADGLFPRILAWAAPHKTSRPQVSVVNTLSPMGFMDWLF